MDIMPNTPILPIPIHSVTPNPSGIFAREAARLNVSSLPPNLIIAITGRIIRAKNIRVP